MDVVSIAGLLVGIAAIVGGQLLEGGHIGSLVQPTAFMIVIGGTFGAVLLQSPWRVFRKGVAITLWVFKPPVPPLYLIIDQIVSWSAVARREGGGRTGGPGGFH